MPNRFCDISLDLVKGKLGFFFNISCLKIEIEDTFLFKNVEFGMGHKFTPISHTTYNNREIIDIWITYNKYEQMRLLDFCGEIICS